VPAQPGPSPWGPGRRVFKPESANCVALCHTSGLFMVQSGGSSLPNKYKLVTLKGCKFFFKFEEDHPDILHIYARGLFEPKDAIEIWFEGYMEIVNAKNNRIETYTNSHGIYWYWLDEPMRTKVFIISCFKRTQQ
jgi:hypothetical protein